MTTPKPAFGGHAPSELGAEDAGSKPAFGGHAPSELGVDGQYPLDADTDLCYIIRNVK